MLKSSKREVTLNLVRNKYSSFLMNIYSYILFKLEYGYYILISVTGDLLNTKRFYSNIFTLFSSLNILLFLDYISLFKRSI